MEPSGIKRVVTGVNSTGQSAIVLEGPLPTLVEDTPGVQIGEAWVTPTSPPPLHGDDDLAAGPLQLTPDAGGTALRYFQLPPRGQAGASTAMHVKAALDYVIVLCGRLWLVTETSETELGPGDCVVQRGTLHSWENRGDVPCVAVAAVLGAESKAH